MLVDGYSNFKCPLFNTSDGPRIRYRPENVLFGESFFVTGSRDNWGHKPPFAMELWTYFSSRGPTLHMSGRLADVDKG
jgi:hypothetical protein